MNDQNLMGQISNCLVKGRFEACVLGQDSGEKSQLGVPELIRLSMKKNVPPPLVAEKALDNAMEESIDNHSDKGYRDDVTILIGGNIPVIHSAADVGADYCCGSMLQTVELLRELACPSSKFLPGAFAVNSV